MPYYVTHNGEAIYGIGRTKKESRDKARTVYLEEDTDNRHLPNTFLTQECTKELYWFAQIDGGDAGWITKDDGLLDEGEYIGAYGHPRNSNLKR